MKPEALYLVHIVETAEFLRELLGNDRERFLKDRVVRDAAIKNLANLAESTQHLSTDSKVAYPDIPWRNIAGFRHILVHDYLGDIKHDLIWEAYHAHLPPLLEAAKQLLEKKKP